jgi:uncharacterized phage-like protein YoqJ
MEAYLLPCLEQTVCFTGHRMQHMTAPMDSLMQVTLAVIRALYRMGYRRFLCGGATGFDTLAASCVVQFRREQPDIQLLLALPCADQTRGWGESDVGLYEQLRQEADRVFLLSNHYYAGCMLVRNRFMVDHASRCIAYMEQPVGGTAFTLRYAVKKGLPVLNLAIPEEVRLFLNQDSSAEPPLPF